MPMMPSRAHVRSRPTDAPQSNSHSLNTHEAPPPRYHSISSSSAWRLLFIFAFPATACQIYAIDPAPNIDALFWNILAESFLLLGTVCFNVLVLFGWRTAQRRSLRELLACLAFLILSVVAVCTAWALWALEMRQWVGLAMFAAEMGLCVVSVESLVLTEGWKRR